VARDEWHVVATLDAFLVLQLLADRQGAMVGRSSEEKYGWNVGELLDLLVKTFEKKDASLDRAVSSPARVDDFETHRKSG
jgi:hypothetical protein